MKKIKIAWIADKQDYKEPDVWLKRVGYVDPNEVEAIFPRNWNIKNKIYISVLKMKSGDSQKVWGSPRRLHKILFENGNEGPYR